MTPLRERLGVAIQRQRQVHGLSQSQLAKLAKLSLKYVGEIERGEANVSMDALKRLTTALEWDPFELPPREQDTLPEGARTLLLAELTHMQHLVQTAISWVQTLDAAMVGGPPSRTLSRIRPRGPKTYCRHLGHVVVAADVASTTAVRSPTRKRSCDTSAAGLGVVG